MKGQLVERGRTQLAQQLAGGVMNAPGKVIDLIRCVQRLLWILCTLDQLRVDLNGGNVLPNFVVQLPRQTLARIFFAADQLLS